MWLQDRVVRESGKCLTLGESCLMGSYILSSQGRRIVCSLSTSFQFTVFSGPESSGKLSVTGGSAVGGLGVR